MSTLQAVELGILGPLQVRQGGAPVMIPGAKPRAILTMLGLHSGSVVSAETLIELLWGDDPPRTAAKALQTHISALRRTLGDGFVLTEGTGWTLAESEIDASRYKSAARLGRDAAAAGDTSQALTRFEEARALWRGIPELPDGRRGTSEKTRWIEGHAALVEDRADALLVKGRAAEIIGELEAAVADAPLRERRWGQLMLALYRAGRQGEALGAYQRARALLAEELGVDPGPELRRLETAIVAQDTALEVPAAQDLPSVTRAVTFLLTDIEGSTAAWEADADAMAVALARHDELVEQVVTSRGGRLIKTRGEGDATFSVFERPSAAAAAAIELQDAIFHEPWGLQEPMRIRVALHTGEVELRDGDYFGRAVNRAARLRSLAVGGQILCSGATAELVVDSLPDDLVLADLGMRQLRNLARPEHVFELRLETADDRREADASDTPLERPGLPAVLTGPGPFVGRGRELERLVSAWQTALAGGMHAVLIAGEPGVGKTRLAGEWSQRAYQQEAVVLYGRCDEDLGAPYQPFAEALRSLMPCLGPSRLRGMRGVEALLPLVPGLTDVLPDLAAPTRADPETERYALFDAVVALLEVASTSAPVVLILDDLHWAAKPTLLLLRHLLRFGDHARVQIVGTYRSTDLDRSHPLAAMLADLHRDGTANRLALSGLDEDDVTAYVTGAGYDDEELARALASVTGGNPFFLIEALRHVDESGGRWDPSTLPQGVREAVSRRLSRLPAETNKALAAAAVVGSRFAVELVERVVEDDLVDAFDEACKAGIVIEEPGGRYRFNHALVRQSLLAELPSVRRMRLHQRIATTLETQPGADDELLAELAHHYFECAWAGNAAKAVEYCRRAADQAVARLAYEGAADLYGQALHALEEIDDELPDRADQTAELLVARCEALLAAGDVASAAGTVSQLQEATVNSARLAAWATCFDGQLSMLIDPERLDEVETALGSAAQKLAELDDAAGEANAHTVRAACLARLGRIGDAEIALDDALTAARRARDHRRVNAVLAGAPLAALWGPNPVPRAGGRCLDVVRLLRITTDSPAVEATSTRCQALLEAFRGRAEAARRMIDSARRTVSELGLRHALLEVEQFAGIVDLVADDPAAAESHLRQAYNGFRRMGLDADTAESAALLGRTCLALDRDSEADELCTESERLAGHALKASIAWRTLRAKLLSRANDHDEARRVADAAVSLAERTDALVDHGDACLTLATVLGAAGDVAGARAAAERAVDLYERKGAAALAETARRVVGQRAVPTVPTPPKAPAVEPDNACVRAIGRLDAAVHRGAWSEVEQLITASVSVENRRKIVGFPRADFPSSEYASQARRYHAIGPVRHRRTVVAIRGESVALTRLELGTADVGPGAPQDEALQLFGLDKDGRIAMEVWFDLDDMDGAVAELDAAYTRIEEVHPREPLENAATRVDDQAFAIFADRRCDEIGALYADDIHVEDRRQGLRRESNDRATAVNNVRAIAALGADITNKPLALRGDRLCLSRVRFEQGDPRPDAFDVETLEITEVDTDGLMIARVVFDPDDFEAAIVELETRYLAGEAAPHSQTWSAITRIVASINRHELPATTRDWVNIDHRRATAVAPGDAIAYIRASWDGSTGGMHVVNVHRLNNLGAVMTYLGYGTSQEGFEAEWRGVYVLTVEGDLVNCWELFDEAGLDAALARFDQLSRPAPRLENTASQVIEHFLECFVARDWTGMADLLAGNMSSEDRRRVVNAGIRQDRDAELRDFRLAADLEVTSATSDVIATRGKRLVLISSRLSRSDEEPEAFQVGLLWLVQADAEDRIAAWLTFDPNDFDAAIAELDARYLAGEAAAHGNVLQPVIDTVGELNRHEPGPMLGRLAYADHRRVPFGSGEAYGRAIEELWTLVPNARYWTRAVHALDAHGLVSTLVIEATDAHGNELQWGRAFLFLSDGPRIEVYEEDDVDAALARFEELRPQARRVENAASQAAESYLARYAARDWDALAKILADDIVTDDRRRVVNAGIRHGRDAEIASLRAYADAGITHMTFVVIAARGERLIFARASGAGGDSGEFRNELLGVVEINSHNQIAALVVFDVDAFDTAFEELEARYIAGEAAAHAATWSMIVDGYAALNRHELPPTAPDLVSIDHRRGTAFAPGDLIQYVRGGWDVIQRTRNYVEAVHRLNNLGAVVTHAAHLTSKEGFDGEWRSIDLYTFEGEMFNRAEIFDEADADGALAMFDQLSRPAPRLENAASRVAERAWGYFATGDWDAVAQIAAENVSVDDRRRVVNAGVIHGRDAAIEGTQATVGVGFTMTMVGAVATRGERLALTRVRVSGRDPETIQNDALNIVEIDAEERIVADVVFDLEDFEAAVAELDARYIAGETAADARTWSVIADSYAAFNRHEVPATEDWVFIDHRQGTPFEPSDMTPSIRTIWDLTPDLSVHVEAVHRLNSSGAVITHQGHGSSQEGFDAEWRAIDLFMVDGDRINRCEVFDETDLHAALAKFDQLSRPAPGLENAASRVVDRFLEYYAAGDWQAMAEMLADNYSSDDRRRLVGSGVRHGRDAHIADMRARADMWLTNRTSTVMATRGERLALMRIGLSSRDQGHEGFVTELLIVNEINADERLAGGVAFDLDDFDAATAELDARYLAGEAAAHARTWSVIARTCAAFNRRKFPSRTTNSVYIDHRPLVTNDATDLTANIRAIWDLMDVSIYIAETVHRLSDLGAVVTQTLKGTSKEGLDIESRMIDVFTVEGDLVSRVEVFDEADIDAALARFDELHQQPQLENAASQAAERFLTQFATRDWTAIAETFADNFSSDDRRRVVGAGVRHGRDAEIADLRSIADVGNTNVTSTPVATRGERLVLTHGRLWFRGEGPDAFFSESLSIVEVNTDERIVALVSFDIDDIDAAFEELDRRYLAGEAAAHRRIWSAIIGGYAALNRHEVPATTPDWVNVDHRRGIAFASGELARYIRATFDVAPDIRIRIEVVHQLTSFGAVISYSGQGTSQEGFAAVWRETTVFIVDGDLVSRCEMYDDADLDAALARFDELSRQPLLENAATRTWARVADAFNRRDVDGLLALANADSRNEDRRKGLRDVVEGQGRRNALEVMFETVPSSWRMDVEPIAVRGSRLSLTRGCHRDVDDADRPIVVELLHIVELGDDDLVHAFVSFDPDDIGAALEELDARYLAGEAVSHAHTWSVIMRAEAALNRRELPSTMPDWVNIDHRRGTSFASGEMAALLDVVWNLTTDLSSFIQAVHRLDDLGAVVTSMAHETSQEGFTAEWRVVSLVTVEGDRLSRCEVFDEADLGAALARFDELSVDAAN